MLPTLFRVGFAAMVVYRAEIVVWILTTTMPLIMFAMWSALAIEGPLGRFDSAAFASYFLVMLVVRQLSGSWVVWELNQKIRTGQLSMDLLRPLHPLVRLATDNLSAVPLRIMVLVPIVAGAAVALSGIRVSADPTHWMLGTWAVFGAWFLTFAFQALIGLLAFYTQQSLAVQELWFGIWALFSGYLMPLELAPSLLAAKRWLPFYSMSGMPTELILGYIHDDALGSALLTQAAWMAIAFCAMLFSFQRSLRRFEAYGN